MRMRGGSRKPSRLRLSILLLSRKRRKRRSRRTTVARQRRILSLVVVEIRTGADRINPIAILTVPFHRLTQPVLERDGRLPAQFALHLRAVDRIAAIVA